MVLMNETKDSYLRRDFLKTSGAIGGALAAGFPAILSGAPAANALKVGLVGCGGRGTGAAAEALKADDYAELTAMADVFPEKIEASLVELRQASADKVKVEPSRQFDLPSDRRVGASPDLLDQSCREKPATC